jgi:hypothetical protein
VREGARVTSGAAAPTARYFGQTTPGMMPERFAVGVVSTDAIELNGVFTPDFREFFFARMIDGVQTIHHSVLDAEEWSAPRPLLLFPGGTHAVADDMAVSPDGRELFFLGNHPHAFDGGVRSADIWRSRRVDGVWSTAEVVPPPISTADSEVYPVIVADGSLYFTSTRPGGPGRSNLYRAQRLQDGSFDEPVLLGAPLNSEHGTGDTFVAPDESYMILTSNRPGGRGGGDLYVSFRLQDGGWSEPVPLGDTVNTDQIEYCPMVTPDGRFLFFSRRRGSWDDVVSGDVYWVDARIVDRFRPVR